MQLSAVLDTGSMRTHTSKSFLPSQQIWAQDDKYPPPPPNIWHLTILVYLQSINKINAYVLNYWALGWLLVIPIMKALSIVLPLNNSPISRFHLAMGLFWFWDWFRSFEHYSFHLKYMNIIDTIQENQSTVMCKWKAFRSATLANVLLLKLQVSTLKKLQSIQGPT